MSSPSTSPTLKRRAGSAPVAHLFKPPRSQRDFFTGRKQRKHANNTALRRDVFLRKTQLQPLPEIRFTLDDGDDSDDETTDSPPITRVMSGGPALQYALDPTAALRLLAHVPIRAPEETQSSAAYFMLERMRHADEHNPGGGWLLDGMRMGKTQVGGMVKLALVQTRVSLGQARFGRTVRPTLVLGPKESVPVWPKEMADGIGGDVLQVFAFDTDDLPALVQEYGLGKLMDKLREETDMIVTSYAFLTLTQARFAHNPGYGDNAIAQFLKTLEYDMVICDEAHHICNHHTLGYAAVRALKADAKWLFSGTLISNNLNEIRSALALVGVSEEVLQSAALEEKQALATFARPFWIRRVLEIPEPIPCHRVKWTSRPEMLLWRRMVTVFNDAVQKARHHLKQRINLLAMLPPDDDEEDDMEEEDALPLYPNAQELPLDLGVEGGQTELRWLQHLRRFCLSPYLCQNLFSHNPGSAAVAGIECIPMPADVHFFPWSLEQVFPRQEKISKKKKRDDSDAMDVASVEDEDDHLKELMRCMVLEALGVEVTTPDHPLRTRVIPPVSPKEGWVCRTLLSEFTDVCGEKVVIFSNFRKPLERLAFLLDLRLRLGIPGARAFAHVHGGISQQQREQERLRFMNDPGCGVLLAIIDIYKESIDLTVANHVVLYDPWWTPRDEFQAIHRILGVKQTRKTYRYRLIQDGTIDQIVADVADLKIALDLEILPPTRVEEERTNTKKVWNLMGGM